MSEDEARTKECHRTLNPVQVQGVFGNSSIGVQPMKCIASACMAWRTYHEEITRETADGTSYRAELHGFCGLAGAPQ